MSPADSAQHTPGPWHFSASLGKPTNHAVYERRALRTVVNLAPEFGLRESEANARLIAAAPDLLAALAGCAAALKEAGKDFAVANRHAARPNLYELHEQTARAAIARAKGGAL